MGNLRNFVVTGAGSGLGQAIARRLVMNGQANVLGVSLEAAPLVEMEADLGPRFRGFAADLLEPESAAASIEACSKAFGPVDVLINNVGAGNSMPLHQASDEDLMFFININLGTTFRMSREALKVMLPARSGVILNMVSALAMVAQPGQAPYVAAKGALIALTKQMAAEYGPYNVRVNAVAPGLTETPFTAERIADGIFDGVINATPLRKLSKADDIAAMTEFLCSPDADNVTGQVIAVDGGWSMSKT